MKIALCYDLPKDREKNDILMDRQVSFLMRNLAALGHEPIAAGFSGSPEKYSETVKKVKPDLLWNLFASFNGSVKHAYLGVLLLDDIGIAHTGSSARSALFTTDDSISRTIMADAGIPVLPHYRLGDDPPEPVHGTWHLRPVGGGMDDIPVTVADFEDLQKAIVLQSLKGEYYAERQISGLRLYISMLGTVRGLTVVGAAMEERDGSISFDTVPAELLKAADVRGMAAKAATVLSLHGFSMLSVSISAKGRAYVTGVDTRPPLTDDSIFCRTCERAGISGLDVLQVLIATAHKK